MKHLTLCLLMFIIPDSLCLFDSFTGWMFGSGKTTENVKQQFPGVVPNAKFEILSTDEQFLSEFSKYLLETGKESPLGACLHMAIYQYTSRKKCSQLTEEELSKLSVNLLNCQSHTENRPVYVCRTEMTLGECTKEMDGSTWNAYHLMNNRARAMCYATQQEHFRRLTEMTVTKLALSAKDQLEAMEALQKGQDTLHSLTTETVRNLYDSQQELLGTHRELQMAHQDVMTHISGNIDTLVQEKALISAGNKQLAEMTETIRKKLDITTSRLTNQDSNQKKSHQQIMEDLNLIHSKAQDALQKLDTSSQFLLKNHKEMSHHYQVLYENILKINSTIEHLLSTVNAMQEKLDKKISWFSHLIGSTEDKLTILLGVGQHLCYFLGMAIMALYLQVPRLSRLTVLASVLVSAVMQFQFDYCIGFGNVTTFCMAILGGNCLYHIWKEKKGSSRGATLFSLKNKEEDKTREQRESLLNAEELQALTATLGRLYDSLNDSNISINTSHVQNHFPPTHDTADRVHSTQRTEIRQPPPRPDSSTMPDELEHVRRYINDLDDRISASSRHSRDSISTPIPSTSYRRSSRASTPNSSVSTKCKGRTRAGTPCRLYAVSGQDYCNKHRQLS